MSGINGTAPATAPAIPQHPTEKLLGKTGGELSHQFWAWKYQNREDEYYAYPENPQQNVALHQQGDIWFLAGLEAREGFGEHEVTEVVREVEVPAGKAIVHLLMDTSFGNFEFEDPSTVTEAEARGWADYLESDLMALAAWVDGKPVPSDYLWTQQLSPSPWTDTRIGPTPEDSLYGFPTGTEGPIASQGAYLFIPPLSPGKHTIRVLAKDVDGAISDVTHNITAK